MKPETASVQISFRLTQGIADELALQAQAAGMSAGEYARKLVITALADAIDPEAQPLTRKDCAAEFAKLQAQLLEHLASRTTSGQPTNVMTQVKRLREDLATVVIALLVGIGNQDIDEATAFAQERLMIDYPK